MTAKPPVSRVAGSALSRDGAEGPGAAGASVSPGGSSPPPPAPLRCSGYRFKGYLERPEGRRAVIECDGGVLATCDGPLGYRALESGQRWQPARMEQTGWVETGPERVVP